MTWNDIAESDTEGHDIEAHTMTHPHLNKLSPSLCLLDHGINSTIFAYPFGEGWDNPEVVKMVSKYFDLTRTNSKTSLTFLNCDGIIEDYYTFRPSPCCYGSVELLLMELVRNQSNEW
jgi:hypothetical protein